MTRLTLITFIINRTYVSHIWTQTNYTILLLRKVKGWNMIIFKYLLQTSKVQCFLATNNFEKESLKWDFYLLVTNIRPREALLLLLLLLLSRFNPVWLLQPTRLHRPWDSPGKNTGVGCHFLLQCMKVKSEREVAQLCPTLSDPMDYSLPGSSIHGIFQARVLEWGAIAFSEERL